ncbi:hypothetical protein [Pelagovum pacificum]|uniref:hypothetical protein n=1 Tax=Pelagovum pacificum TaxID=2588711 RepID=UPI0018CFD6E2|nr:hypothetical protein [Pelagovum pacificum]QQA44406.1 hypothetical protein I8N54_07490 [Pelagovum pacificum]
MTYLKTTMAALIATLPAAAFAQTDALENEIEMDGPMTFEQVSEMYPDVEMTEFAAVDTNGDGMLDEAEFEDFEELDIDDDDDVDGGDNDD